MMPARVKLINLIPPSEFESSFWGRFLKWAITAGRKVIILTELVVIMAFLSRFKLDEDIRRYNEEISGKRNLLESRKSFEDDFNRLKSKITAAKAVEKEQSDASNTLGKISGYVPQEVRLLNLSITKDVTNLVGESLNERAFKEMVLRMDRDTDWKSIELVSLLAQEGKAIGFVLNIYK